MHTARLILFTALGISSGTFAFGDGVQFSAADAGKPGVVAAFGSKEISHADLEAEDPAVFAARMELFRAQKAAAARIIQKQVVESAAKKEGLSPAEFLARELGKAGSAVPEEEVNAYLREHSAADPKLAPKDLRRQVKELLQLDKLTSAATKGSARLYLQAPRPYAPVSVKVEGEPSLGEPGAPITIVEFGDFECEYCAQARSRITELRKVYGRRVRFVFKHFPLPIHPAARTAAEASMCVHEQGAEKFWKFYELAYNQRRDLSAEKLRKLAKDAGADPAKVDACLKAGKFAAHVDASMLEGKKLGVDSTPSFIVAGRLFKGTPSLAELREILGD